MNVQMYKCINVHNYKSGISNCALFFVPVNYGISIFHLYIGVILKKQDEKEYMDNRDEHWPMTNKKWYYHHGNKLGIYQWICHGN